MFQITLEAARVNARKTQKQVAEYMGKNVSTIQKWEKGLTVPDAIEFEQLCEYYNAPRSAIFLSRNQT